MTDWTLDVLPVGPLQMNAVLLLAPAADGGTGEAILIDPGEEAPRLLGRIAAAGCRLTHLLATHGHFDHVGAAAAVQDACGLPLRCHPADRPFIEHLPEIQESWGFPPSRVPEIVADLNDGVTVPFASDLIRVRHVPGHSPGQVMFLLPGHAIVGDCLFQGSIGRTDLPGGDGPTLEKSIRERIYALPGETIVGPGHGPNSTVGRERTTNPFVRG